MTSDDHVNLKETQKQRYIVMGTDFDKQRAKNSYFCQITKMCMRKAQTLAKSKSGREGMLDFSASEPWFSIASVGGVMEITAKELEKVNEEVEESKKILQKLSNEINQTYELVEPELLKTIKRIRDARQTVSMELQGSLSIMRDVRKFFLESDYEKEVERLERFVNLGERMRILIKDGTMDALIDASIKLAIKE
ncbi:MAG: hypothetical protein U9N62_04455 [Thermotogota bacterium]|nr:hypothetical protein [Thermotogota bacterium]